MLQTCLGLMCDRQAWGSPSWKAPEAVFLDLTTPEWSLAHVARLIGIQNGH
jgi:hypothetical protein